MRDQYNNRTKQLVWLIAPAGPEQAMCLSSFTYTPSKIWNGALTRFRNEEQSCLFTILLTGSQGVQATGGDISFSFQIDYHATFGYQFAPSTLHYYLLHIMLPLSREDSKHLHRELPSTSPWLPNLL